MVTPVGLELLAMLDHGADRHLPGVALAWLAGPPEQAGEPTSLGPEPDLPDGTGRDVLGALQVRLHRLRRADDLVGGVDLAARVDHRLRQAIRLLPRLDGGRLRRPALRLVAGYGQRRAGCGRTPEPDRLPAGRTGWHCGPRRWAMTGNWPRTYSDR